MTAEATPLRRAQARIRQLYESGTSQAHQFRYALLVFDLVALLFIVATSFIPRNDVVEVLDVLFGVIMLADFSARLFISRHRLRDLAHPVAWTDIAAIVSFLAPLVGEAMGFLRILRTLRLLRSYQLLMRLSGPAERGLAGMLHVERPPNPEIFDGKIEAGSGQLHRTDGFLSEWSVHGRPVSIG